jgi:cell division septation protein DedD
MSDEGFHEINLNGKQLVFLFMAAAVVAVVVFLSGVMVGRGVRTETAAAPAGVAAAAADLAAPGAASTAAPPGAVGAVPPGGDPRSGRPAAPPATPPPPVADDIVRDATSGDRGAAATTDKGAVAASGREAGSKPAAPAGQADAAGTAAKTSSRAPEAATPSYAVQVAAPKDRGAAEAIAKRLAGKGYAAFVLDPSAVGAGPVYYRVRVGPFKTRREADEAKRRLEKEEQFKPFITR